MPKWKWDLDGQLEYVKSIVNIPSFDKSYKAVCKRFLIEANIAQHKRYYDEKNKKENDIKKKDNQFFRHPNGYDYLDFVEINIVFIRDFLCDEPDPKRGIDAIIAVLENLRNDKFVLDNELQKRIDILKQWKKNLIVYQEENHIRRITKDWMQSIKHIVMI